MSQEIEDAIKHKNWEKVRRLVLKDLSKEPKSHWLLARLALTYYEEYKYERALIIGQRAYKLQPDCPLVLWDLAGTFNMLGRNQEAMAIYHRLIRRGVKAIAFGDCGEGLAWARGLVADCWYRLALCSIKLRRTAKAIKYYEQHLALRGSGCRSIYALKDVRKEYNALNPPLCSRQAPEGSSHGAGCSSSLKF